MDKDISTLLREIKDSTSWSEPRIAAELGTSQPTVNRILNGQTDCMGSTLNAITALHRLRCGPKSKPPKPRKPTRRPAAPP
ncbi:MAG: hypothetical protein WA191_07055 [Telluria sp.]